MPAENIYLLCALSLFIPTASFAKPKEISKDVTIDGKVYQHVQGWWDNGKPWYDGTYREYKKYGLYTEWNKEGVKTEECHWQADYLQGHCQRWHDNGTLAEEADYDHHELKGLHRIWHPNGAQQEVSQFESGTPHGEYRTWYPSGKDRILAHFEKGRPTGEWVHWDESGAVLEKVVPRAGIASVETTGPLATPVPGFALVVSQGSGLHGFDTLKIAENGRATYDFAKWRLKVERRGVSGLSKGEIYQDVKWWHAEFRLSDAQLKAVVRILAEVGYFKLKDKYINRNVQDGTQWTVRAQQGGQTKEIYCSNEFPKALQRLGQFVHQEILDPQDFALLAAVPAGDQRNLEFLKP